MFSLPLQSYEHSLKQMVLAFLLLFSWHGKNLGESIQKVSSREDSMSPTRERRTMSFKTEPLPTAINPSWLNCTTGPFEKWVLR